MESDFVAGVVWQSVFAQEMRNSYDFCGWILAVCAPVTEYAGDAGNVGDAV